MSSSNNSHISDDEYPNDDPMENRSTDEEPTENESEEEDPSEDEPTEGPARFPPFELNRRNPNRPFTFRGTPMTVQAPQPTTYPVLPNDPYQPPSPHPNQWTGTGETSTQAQTGEPSHPTIPLLIFRLDTHENDIDTLKDNLEALPPPEDFYEMKASMEFFWRSFKELRTEVEQLRTYVAGVPRLVLDAERRVIKAENEVSKLTAKVSAQDQTIAYMIQKGM